MTTKDIWSLYFAHLLDLLTRRRAKIETLILEQVQEEIASRYSHLAGRTRIYRDAAVGFLEERLYECRDDYWEKFLRPLVENITAAEIMEVAEQLSWYDMQREKEEIDERIETCLNIHRSPEDILEVLVEEFGAFPNRSIIAAYSAKPKPNYLPEYALAVAIQQVVRADRG
ncbi:MAG: hypothetical protein ABIF82_07520 [Planctomycetota bacterium]